MKNNRLTIKQREAVELLVMKDINGMSNNQIAEKLDIDRSTLYRWKLEPAFIDEMNRLAEDFQKSFLSDAYGELRKILLFSNNPAHKLKALELFMKNQGRLKDVQEVSARVEADVSVEDMLNSLGV